MNCRLPHEEVLYINASSRSWARYLKHNIYLGVRRCTIKISLVAIVIHMTRREKPLITTNQFGTSSLISYLFDQEMLKESVNLRYVKNEEE